MNAKSKREPSVAISSPLAHAILRDLLLVELDAEAGAIGHNQAAVSILEALFDDVVEVERPGDLCRLFTGKARDRIDRRFGHRGGGGREMEICRVADARFGGPVDVAGDATRPTDRI